MLESDDRSDGKTEYSDWLKSPRCYGRDVSSDRSVHTEFAVKPECSQRTRVWGLAEKVRRILPDSILFWRMDARHEID